MKDLAPTQEARAHRNVQRTAKNLILIQNQIGSRSHRLPGNRFNTHATLRIAGQ
uniref:Uncharacterized protein n=1 Tax=Arundo donax TaxID=35708 RepID=A0A0A9HL84_ARUDO